MTIVFLSLRFLKSPGERFASMAAFLAVLATFLGTLSVVVVLAAMDGFRQDLSQRLFSSTSHLIVQSAGGPEESERLAQLLETLPGVLKAQPGAAIDALATANGRSLGLRLIGDPSLEGAIVPQQIAGRLNAITGDTLQLTVPKWTSLGVSAFQLRVDIQGMDPAPAAAIPQIRIPLEAAIDLAGTSQARAEALLEDPWQAPQLITRAQHLMPNAEILTWQDENKALTGALAVERIAMGLILGAIVLVAGLNTASASAMLSSGKRKQMASLRAMGASKREIFCTLLLAGGGPAITGAALGGLGGYLLASYPGFTSSLLVFLTGTSESFARIPFLPNLETTLCVAGGGVLVGLIAALWPAWRVASLDPVEAFRG